MKKLMSLIIVAGLFMAAPAILVAGDEAPTKKQAETAEKRAEIDKVAKEALAEVLEKSENAKGLYDKAAGWAVFDNMRITFIVSGGGGSGVAVNKASDKRTYMKMGTGGLSFGIGAQKYQVIMFFDTEERLDKFITKGWKAESGADASAGTKGAAVGTGFVNGIAIYKITEKGLMASADISGTKYSLNKKLNE
jgi:lipid-binding SYLF domain-containing protein